MKTFCVNCRRPRNFVEVHDLNGRPYVGCEVCEWMAYPQAEGLQWFYELLFENKKKSNSNI